MSMHEPSRWVIFGGPSMECCKVLGGWWGGYLDSDEWRASSGITKIEEKPDCYLIHNESGSIYKCYKGCEGVTSLSGSILAKIQDKYPDVHTLTVEEYYEWEKERKDSDGA